MTRVLVLITCIIHVMLGHPPILLVQHIQRFPIESQIGIVDAVWQFPSFCIQVDLDVSGLLCYDIGDQEVILVLSGAGFCRHRHRVENVTVLRVED